MPHRAIFSGRGNRLHGARQGGLLVDEGGDAVWAMDLDGRTLQKLGELNAPRGIAIMANASAVVAIQEIEAEAEAMTSATRATRSDCIVQIGAGCKPWATENEWAYEVQPVTVE